MCINQKETLSISANPNLPSDIDHQFQATDKCSRMAKSGNFKTPWNQKGGRDLSTKNSMLANNHSTASVTELNTRPKELDANKQSTPNFNEDLHQQASQFQNSYSGQLGNNIPSMFGEFTHNNYIDQRTYSYPGTYAHWSNSDGYRPITEQSEGVALHNHDKEISNARHHDFTSAVTVDNYHRQNDLYALGNSILTSSQGNCNPANVSMAAYLEQSNELHQEKKMGLTRHSNGENWHSNESHGLTDASRSEPSHGILSAALITNDQSQAASTISTVATNSLLDGAKQATSRAFNMQSTSGSIVYPPTTCPKLSSNSDLSTITRTVSSESAQENQTNSFYTTYDEQPRQELIDTSRLAVATNLYNGNDLVVNHHQQQNCFTLIGESSHLNANISNGSRPDTIDLAEQQQPHVYLPCSNLDSSSNFMAYPPAHHSDPPVLTYENNSDGGANGVDRSTHRNGPTSNSINAYYPQQQPILPAYQVGVVFGLDDKQTNANGEDNKFATTNPTTIHHHSASSPIKFTSSSTQSIQTQPPLASTYSYDNPYCSTNWPTNTNIETMSSTDNSVVKLSDFNQNESSHHYHHDRFLTAGFENPTNRLHVKQISPHQRMEQAPMVKYHDYNTNTYNFNPPHEQVAVTTEAGNVDGTTHDYALAPGSHPIENHVTSHHGGFNHQASHQFPITY